MSPKGTTTRSPPLGKRVGQRVGSTVGAELASRDFTPMFEKASHRKARPVRNGVGAPQAEAHLVAPAVTAAVVMNADHGVSIRHDAPFDDGVVRVRFKMHDKKGIGFNFNDPKCKASHAGHICHVGVKPHVVDFRDGKTGVFDLKIREKRLADATKEEIAKLTKGKSAYHKVKLETNKWYEMTIVIQGDTMSGYIDGKPIGSLKSTGIDHEVKQNIAFAVSGVAEVDDLRIWKLK